MVVCAYSEQPSGRLGHDAPAEDLDVLRGSKIPRWKRWNVSAKQPGVLQFIRRRRKKTQEFTLNLVVNHSLCAPTVVLFTSHCCLCRGQQM